MIFELRQTIFTSDGIEWVQRGAYPVVRLFDNKRVMIDVGGISRAIVLVPMRKGLVRRNAAQS